MLLSLTVVFIDALVCLLGTFVEIIFFRSLSFPSRVEMYYTKWKNKLIAPYTRGIELEAEFIKQDQESKN